MELSIVHRTAGPECASILAELPEWFGIPAANAAYTERAGREPVWVAECDGTAVGIMILADHGFAAIENVLLAVRPTAHRRGIGRALIEQAISVCQERGALYLSVKTLGPSREYEPYARTRAFYEAIGFAPVEEFTSIWGPENPCLFMIKAVPAHMG